MANHPCHYEHLHGYEAVAELKLLPFTAGLVRVPDLHGYEAVAELKPCR
ncbi:hypothetical protein FRUB_06438 [Fimbriiglobus ruber]|uniref:Uncharacterized protein n=1 Tax=Fimbriiglobus ruber TaxID=1908690 RepID=A0A225DFN0_9BACT|nr:hypothetical protein FRUB_06438 [Fimbriiglobus ruber]